MKKLLFILGLLIIGLTSNPLYAQWSTDPNVNNAICTATGDQDFPAICSDGAGGWIITWRDNRNGYDVIYAQRINASGVVMWATDGVVICTAEGSQGIPTICSEGFGGAIITWISDRPHIGLTGGDVYAQRINASGDLLWTEYGVLISSARFPEVVDIVSDGTGGAIILWGDDGYRCGIYTQRVDASGVVQWGPDGFEVHWGVTPSPGIISDGTCGAIIMWGDDYPSYYIYAQRFNASGVEQWAENGVEIGTAASSAICSDGAGGAIIAWNDDRNGNSDIYAQRINVSGDVQWSGDGVEICTEEGSQAYPRIVSDDAGGAIISWIDLRSNIPYGDTYAQRINASGDVQWTGDGVRVFSVYTRDIINDGAGGAITASDSYVQRINASGIVQWGDNGVLFRTHGTLSHLPVISGDDAGNAVITWADDRNGNLDIYAQLANTLVGVNEKPVVPKDFSLSRNYPNPSHSSTTINFFLPKRHYVTLKVFDVFGREMASLVNEELFEGEHSVVFDTKELPSGIYFYRLATPTFSETKLMEIIR